MYKITAEMINDELERRFINAMLDAGEPFKAEFAALLNAAIEAGLVSPPCRILRSKCGQLLSGTIYPDDDAALSSGFSGDTAEHWKGQAD
jgi:hypothetical protein